MSTPSARVAALRAEADRIESASCTGLTASWCPFHGECSCPRNEAGEHVDRYTGEPAMDDPNCPLHSPDSSHGAAELR